MTTAIAPLNATATQLFGLSDDSAASDSSGMREEKLSSGQTATSRLPAPRGSVSSPYQRGDATTNNPNAIATGAIHRRKEARPQVVI
jgi:hypothetical protein